MAKDKIVRLDAIKKGEKIFEATGVSKLKVQRGDEVVTIEVPIKSTGVREVLELMERERPKPPKRKMWIKKEEAEQYGIRVSGPGTWVLVYDLADEAYNEKLREWEQKRNFAILLRGIAVPIEGETDEEKIQTLLDSGLTPQHLNQLLKDILNLTQWEEIELVENLK